MYLLYGFPSVPQNTTHCTWKGKQLPLCLVVFLGSVCEVYLDIEFTICSRNERALKVKWKRRLSGLNEFT